MSSLYKRIKNLDKFGYLVSLTYNCEANTHKTVIGGIFSLFITFIYAVYIMYYMYIMFNNT